MDDLISREALREAMYHEAFETDSDMQKWDSGCWIRYKMFENHLKDAPSVPAVPLDKLCECLVRKRIGFVDEVDGKRLTATLDKALWATLIKEWMEGLDGTD